MSRPPEDGTAPPANGSLTGQVVDGRYRVEALLGRGGMSEVYRARHLRLDRPCALKVIHPSRAADPDAASRFEREATAASRINHPNICAVYDFGIAPDGTRYLAMELLDGSSLARELDGGPVSLERAGRIALDCAAGLEAAHEAGIVHRDLKADNVMLVARGGRESAVITDFGIARGSGDAALTRDGLMVGTPEVMSPEQIAGDPVGAASDQYQLALLVCRLLTGSFPFTGLTTQETMSRRLTSPPLPLRELRPDLDYPPGLQAVLDRALARRARDRYPTVRDFGMALGAALGAPDAPTEVLARGGTGRDSPIPPTRVEERPPAPPRGWRVPVAVVALAGAAGLAWVLLGDRDGATPATPPSPAIADTGVAAPAPPAPAPAPSPGPGADRPRPTTLPSADSVFSEEPAVRRRAREQAEAVYRSAAEADSVRAEAAYLVAATLIPDGLQAAVRVWLERCLALQERASCRSLLRTLP